MKRKQFISSLVLGMGAAAVLPSLVFGEIPTELKIDYIINKPTTIVSIFTDFIRVENSVYRDDFFNGIWFRHFSTKDEMHKFLINLTPEYKFDKLSFIKRIYTESPNNRFPFHPASKSSNFCVIKSITATSHEYNTLPKYIGM